jgi:hypothetical protein
MSAGVADWVPVGISSSHPPHRGRCSPERRLCQLRSFGAFSVKHRDARTRNPRTGATVEVSRKVIPFFKTGKQLSERLNGGQN